MFGLTKKLFVILLTNIVSAANHTKCISLSKKFMTQPVFINLHPNEYGKELRYYTLAVNLR